MEKICNGERVDFQDLLPENVVNQLKDEKINGRRPFPWLYIVIYIVCCPIVVLIPQKVWNLSNTYSWGNYLWHMIPASSYDQWLEYDKQFRSTAVASGGKVKWSTLDQDYLQWGRQLNIHIGWGEVVINGIVANFVPMPPAALITYAVSVVVITKQLNVTGRVAVVPTLLTALEMFLAIRRPLVMVHLQKMTHLFHYHCIYVYIYLDGDALS